MNENPFYCVKTCTEYILDTILSVPVIFVYCTISLHTVQVPQQFTILKIKNLTVPTLQIVQFLQLIDQEQNHMYSSCLHFRKKMAEFPVWLMTQYKTGPVRSCQTGKPSTNSGGKYRYYRRNWNDFFFHNISY